VSLRKEFVLLAMQAGSNRRELCRRFGIAPKTGYKWLLRYAQAGASGLEDRSKRPRRSPARTATEVEQAVVRLRHESRNSWGGRKLARLLARQGGPGGCRRFRVCEPYKEARKGGRKVWRRTGKKESRMRCWTD